MAFSQSSAASGSSSAASSSRVAATPPTSPHTPQRPSPCLFFDSGASACSSDSDMSDGEAGRCASPLSSARRPRQRRRLLPAGDENASPKAAARPVRIVKGTVTPSRAAAIFRMPLAAAALPAAAVPSLPLAPAAAGSKRLYPEAHKTSRPEPSVRSDPLTAWRTAGASLEGPRAAALPTRDLGAALLSMRSGAGLRGPRCIPVPLSSYHRSFQPTRGVFLPAGDDSLAAAHPLCGTFSFAAASTAPGRAFLALGTNDGSIVLRDMSGLAAEPVGMSSSDELAYSSAGDEEDSATFRWKACQGSVFDVAWRADDRALATGGSDYTIRTWDTCTLQQTGIFTGLRGSPRSVTWDPSCASGSVFLSAGRDGAIHLFDTRVTAHMARPQFRPTEGEESVSAAVMSLWGAHTSMPTRPRRGKGSRGAGEGTLMPKGVMSVTYVPSRGAHVVASAGCADGVVKLWDLRSHSGGPPDQASLPHAPTDNDAHLEMEPWEESADLTRGPERFSSSHGISSIVAGDSTLYAASTNGSIYSLALADLSPTLTPLGRAPALSAPAQRGNTLYARLALSGDGRSLALGCHSGTVALWDTWAAARETNHQPVMLQAHAKNFEINAVSWAHGPHGQTLASISDDYSVRLFRSSPLGSASARGSCF